MRSQGDRRPWRFPLVSPQGSLRRRTIGALGHVLVKTFPANASRVESLGRVENWLDRLLVAGLLRRHCAAGTLEQLAHFHLRFWEEEQASAYHAERATVVVNQFRRLHGRVLEPLQRELQSGEFQSLVEIGCGAGRLLEHLASQLPQLHRFIGVDLAAAQIEENKQRSWGSALEFAAADITRWVRDNGQSQRIYLSYGGVLEYLPQAKLAQLFANIAACPPACVVLVEPIGDFDLDNESVSRPYDREMTFAHPYPRMLQKAGFRLVFCERTPNNRLLLVARR